MSFITTNSSLVLHDSKKFIELLNQYGLILANIINVNATSGNADIYNMDLPTLTIDVAPMVAFVGQKTRRVLLVRVCYCLA